ncbi:MAG: hypothetical protein KAI47_25655, partial [Deltaproteobacteria bacterium]|nr:hypothetical protein [Deltaproteobacteria bacterium]
LRRAGAPTTWNTFSRQPPKRLVSFHDTLRSLLILPERRPDRRYKRHVKIKMSKFKRNPGKPVSKTAK